MLWVVGGAGGRAGRDYSCLRACAKKERKNERTKRRIEHERFKKELWTGTPLYSRILYIVLNVNNINNYSNIYYFPILNR